MVTPIRLLVSSGVLLTWLLLPAVTQAAKKPARPAGTGPAATAAAPEAPAAALPASPAPAAPAAAPAPPATAASVSPAPAAAPSPSTTPAATGLPASSTVAAPGPQPPAASAEEPAAAEHPRAGFGFGFGLHTFGSDFGLDLDVVSPQFAKVLVAHLRGGIGWVSGVEAIPRGHLERAALDPGFTLPVHEETWWAYSPIRLGLAGVSGWAGDSVRVYGEGGAVALLPIGAYTAEGIAFGGYGVFGAEIFPAGPPLGFFFELGGQGVAARGDELVGDPIHANGFVANTGLRFYP
ncbi:MAG: hypothetical protein RBU45_14270 [Myxococcota bacterium]|nr:hypothetical protein [Myxococcota bacterium]